MKPRGCDGSTRKGYGNAYVPGMGVMLADGPVSGTTAGTSVCFVQIGDMYCNCWEYVGLEPSNSPCSGSRSTPPTKLFGDYCDNHGNDKSTCGTYTVFWMRLL